MTKPTKKSTTKPTAWKKKLFFCAFLGLLLVALIVWLRWPPRGTLTGTVSYLGKPVPSGSILLIGSDSKTMTTWIQKDGTYKFTGVPLGDAKLAVFEMRRSPGTAGMIQMMGGTIDPKAGKGTGGGFMFVLGGGGKKGSEEEGGFTLVLGGGGQKGSEKEGGKKGAVGKVGGPSFRKGPPVHPAYNDTETSQLRTTIKKGANTYEIELQ